MGKFTRISSDAFDALQLDAGVLLSFYDPSNPYFTPTDNQIIATTSGGINPSCVPNYSDFAEDVDNAPNGLMEFKHSDGWDCKMSFTSIKFNAVGTRLALGAADISTLENGVQKVLPRRDLAQTDFSDIWWVGDKANGGAAAIKLKNALSTGGFSLQTTKNGKGTIAMELTGHVSLAAQNDMPMEFYDIPPETSENLYYIRYQLNHANSSYNGTSVEKGTAYSTVISNGTGRTIYYVDTVQVFMGGMDISGLAVHQGENNQYTVEIPEVQGDLEIMVQTHT